MPLEYFICPDKDVSPISSCMAKCRMGERCLTLPTLKLLSSERVWEGVPSTTQLLNGTMYEFLKLTVSYGVDPDSRAFMLAGTRHHAALEDVAKELGLPSEIALSVDRDIFDLLELDEDGGLVLTDMKLWGSYRVAKVLGLVETGKRPDPSGATYKTTSRFGTAGSPKMVPVFQSMPQEADNWDSEMQLNNYRVMLEDRGIPIKRMQLQVTVRDGGLQVARGRGVERNTNRIQEPKLDDDMVREYFSDKAAALIEAMNSGEWTLPCNDHESWDGTRCDRFCEVWHHCIKGQICHQE